MKFLDSFTSKEHGISVVYVNHKGCVYTGVAEYHPEDAWSEFVGCSYAELKATRKALKDEYKELKNKCEECRKFVKAVEQYKNFDCQSKTAKAMYRQLNRRIKEVNRKADAINAIDLAIKMRLKLEKELKNKQNNKKD